MVRAISGSSVTVDVGASHGLNPGLQGFVWYVRVLPDGTQRQINIARVKLTRVHSEIAEAEVLAWTEPIQVGHRVRFVVPAPLSLPPRPPPSPPSPRPSPPPAPLATRACVGHLFVKTEPPGATVRVDGGPVRDSLVKGLPCGSHRVTVGLMYHEDFEQEVEVREGEIEELTVLLRKRRSTVRIASTPTGAEVFFDGHNRGISPVILDDIEWGEHRVRAEKPGFVPLDEVIVLDRPSVAEYAFILNPAPLKKASVLISAFGYEGVGGLQGLLTLGLLISEYAVELDGELSIDWRIRSTESTVWLPPGSHRLRVLIRHGIARVPQVLYDKIISFAEDSQNQIRINFLTSTLWINEKAEELRLP